MKKNSGHANYKKRCYSFLPSNAKFAEGYELIRRYDSVLAENDSTGHK